MLGQALAFVATVVAVEQHPSEDDAEEDSTLPTSTLVVTDTLIEANAQAVAAPKNRKAKGAQAPAPVKAIFVSAEKVIQLAESRATPRGVRVPASGTRPAGLRLVGVEALGIGLRDGDVLTRALGQPALSSSAVVRAVLVARAKRVRVLEGEFFRGRERWVIRVEQPYLEPERSTLTGERPGPRLLSP